MRKKTQHKLKEPDFEALGHMLVNIYETGYINRNQSYKMSFIKGVVGGLGGVVGATIVVGLLIWMLSFFHNIPLLNRITDNLQNSVQHAQKK